MDLPAVQQPAPDARSDHAPSRDADLAPEPGAAAVPAMVLTQRQKAAVIVRLLLAEGTQLPLDRMPEDLQAELTSEMANLRLIDRDTLRATIEEFAAALDQIGLHFPGTLAGALGLLEPHISPATAARLRREAGVAARGDPWERIAGLAPERLAAVLEEESIEVGAVLLAKLETKRAADLLTRLPGARARALSYAVSRTGSVEPETVRRIGLALASQLDTEPVSAFPEGPVKKVGSILNATPTATRNDVLEGLAEADAAFAEEVRRAIFTFANIPSRIGARDISRVVKAVEPEMLQLALAAAAQYDELQEALEYVLDNMSKRMADALRDEIAEMGAPPGEAGEAAMADFIAEIRRMSDEGELLLLSDE